MNGQICFRSEGKRLFICDSNDVRMPVVPERPGFKFNGWWVTADDSVFEIDEDWLKRQGRNQDIVVNARWINVSYKLEMQDFDTDGYVQDGCIHGDVFFKFHSDGSAAVFSMVTHEKLGSFILDKSDLLKPHCNATCFGHVRYREDDEFPLLYVNVYNSYGKETDRRLGHFGVYRITWNGSSFESELVQIIKVGFTSVRGVWFSSAGPDRSPYGNFIVDTDRNRLWAFVTRDEKKTTRFFSFEMPSISSGEWDDGYGVKVFTLTQSDVLTMFDVPYSWYLQGACYHDGKIYSTEGLGTEANPSAIRVVDLDAQAEDSLADVQTDGYMKEAEFIDVWNGSFWYGTYMKNEVPKAPVFKLTGI